MYGVTDDESDEEDEIMANKAAGGRAARRIRPRPDHFNMWNDEEFFIRFRLTKPTVMRLLSLIEDEISAPSDLNNAVSPMNRLLLTLRFYALGSMMIAIGDFAGITKSTACNIIHQVTAAIARLGRDLIRFPETPEEFEEVQQEFYAIARFPKIISVIDCTHIKIQSVGGDQAETFRNRKGFFSINVQTLSAPNLRIMDIVARWPGSTHDRTIFNNSSVKGRFDRGEMNGGLIIGDSGYTSSPYMLIPLRNPVTPAENLYNESQIRTRNVVERQYGVWKRRFPILSVGMKVRVDHVLPIIVATAVLHNMACDAEEAMPPLDPELGQELNIEQDQAMPDLPNELQGDVTMRQNLIQNHFQVLLN